MEIIYVNDGSSDDTKNAIQKICANDQRVRLINLNTNSGQSYATMQGIKAATGNYIAMLDADLQNDPADILLLLQKLNGSCEGVCGWRKNRKDRPIFVISSVIANNLIRVLFGLKVHDSGCSLRVVKAECLKRLKYFKNFHRYIPILLHLNNVRLTECEVNHRWRGEGRSNYSIFKSLFVVKELIFIRLFYKG
ncbi:MAG: glycosyltransferase [Bacteroidetes bacterium]|nr:glycosyltransferase [Bacteroidota bacterium]